MKNYLYTLVLCSILTSCSTTSNKDISSRDLSDNQREAFIHFFKVQTYCSCLSHSYENKEIIDLISKEDLLGTYDELANNHIQRVIDSLGFKTSKSITAETYPYFEGKKRIIEKCLQFYTSQKLDSIALSQYDLHHKSYK